MVALGTFLAVFALITPCLSITVSPALDPLPQPRHVSSRRLEGYATERWLPRPRRNWSRKRQTSEIPQLQTGEDVPLHTRSRIINQRRSLDNGSIINLATAHDTYIVPVIFGSPPAAYPLQLDLGSSDLILASTLCGDGCPKSDGNSINPYYDAQRHSTSFEAVSANQTWWNVSFADTRTAGGFVARENVSIGNSQVQGQVFGMMNATNLTLAEQEISGIMGLGFPRLSVIARSLLSSRPAESASSITSASSSTPTSASGSAAVASASAAAPPRSSSAYLPTFLESLVTAPHIPYPVFGLALAPPPTNTSSTASSSAAPSSSARFAASIGSLTLGGVSSLYVSDQPGSGLTRDDIEWHAVVPFARVADGNDTIQGASTESVAGSGLPSSQIPSATSSVAAASTSGVARKRQDTSTSDLMSASAAGLVSASASAAAPTGPAPQSLRELEDEAYLYWTIELANVSVNGTDIGLESTYSYLDVPPIALLDAGFNGISGPIAQVAKIFDSIPEARQASTGQWAVPCDTRMTLGFSFGGRYVQLQPSEWMYASIASSSFCLAWPVGTGPASDGIDWQLGTPFLKKVYSVFSYGINGEQAPLVGFLPIPDPVASMPSGSSSAISSGTSSGAEGVVSSSSVPQMSPYGPTPTTIKAYEATATVATELPNAVLPVPTYSLPSYIYGHGSAVTLGALQTLGLANASAYDVGDVPIILAPNMSDPASSSAGTVGIGGTNTDGGAQSGARLGRGCSVWLAGMAMAGAWAGSVF